MQIVTDSAADLSAAQLEELNIHTVPLSIQLDGKTYRSGVDLQPDGFYTLLSQTESFPTTSQPSPGDFAALYRQLAQTDPDILSIHISSGLSGTLNAARTGASLVPEAHVTFFDSKTLSSPLGWMVQAAAYALRNHWTVEQILDRLRQMQTRTQGLFTLDSLKYLIHGGRISHLKGLLASMLRIQTCDRTGKNQWSLRHLRTGNDLETRPEQDPGSRRLDVLRGTTLARSAVAWAKPGRCRIPAPGDQQEIYLPVRSGCRGRSRVGRAYRPQPGRFGRGRPGYFRRAFLAAQVSKLESIRGTDTPGDDQSWSIV